MKRKVVIAALFAGICGVSNAQFWNYSEPMKLGGTVNTVESEESIPVFSKDSSILYFVRTYSDDNKGDAQDQDIWFSRKDGAGSYGDCERLKGVNNKYNNAVLGVNKTGTSMYLLNSYDGKRDLVKGVAKSTGSASQWGKPEGIDIPGLDIDGGFYGFHVNENETVIIISYEGPGTKGQEDLYVSTKNGSSWSSPVHMGSNINSTGYEISPFLSESTDTLYFSSNGFGGQGDADIFYSVKQGSWSSWSKPTNLGAVINTPKFDAYFIHSGSQAYWSSNRDSELSDIWMVNILTPPPPMISGIGTDVTVYQGSDGKIDATPDSGVPPYTYLWSNGATNEDPQGLIAGSYDVTLTDAIGQTAQTTVVIGEPGPALDIAMKHMFGYNANKLTVEDGALKNFVETIEAQLAAGRENVSITIVSSASKVRTATWGTNEKLAKSRATEIQKVLEGYYASKDLTSKVTIEVLSSVVDGPDYKGDFENQDKYQPFQFIELKTK